MSEMDEHTLELAQGCMKALGEYANDVTLLDAERSAAINLTGITVGARLLKEAKEEETEGSIEGGAVLRVVLSQLSEVFLWLYAVVKDYETRIQGLEVEVETLRRKGNRDDEKEG